MQAMWVSLSLLVQLFMCVYERL